MFISDSYIQILVFIYNNDAGKIEVPAPNTKNLAVTWNALRVAKSEWKAKQIVKKSL